MVANGGTDRTDFINELLIANKSSGRAKESRGKLCLSSQNFEGYRHFFLLWLYLFWRIQNPKVRGIFFISLIFMLPLNMGSVVMKSPHLFSSKPNQLSWDVKEKWDVCLTEYLSFFSDWEVPVASCAFSFL